MKPSRFPHAKVWLAALTVSLLADAAVAAGDPPRERVLMDFGWEFHLGDNANWGAKLDKAGEGRGPLELSFNGRSWRGVNLPHDWVVELPFDARADHSHGYKAIGPDFPANNVGWYRRVFKLTDADRGKRLWLEFDGIYRDSRVYVNGFPVAHQESGYNGFRCDISDVANRPGENVVAVRVDASQFEGWFYEGAGIYRHVWLVKTQPLAIAPDGVFVYSSFPNNVPEGEATIHLETQLLNAQKPPAAAKVSWQILDPDGGVVAAAEVEAGAETVVRQTARIASPALWSPESPKLYKLVTTVASDGRTVDRLETEFGIRTVGFDATRGFLLNGQPCVIKGTCDHQDHAGVGSAIPDALQRFRLARLKEMGSNAIRTSHNAPTPELLDICDHLGLLVMDENRRLGSDAQNLAYLEGQIRRDRNHASVFIWSLANEEHSLQRSPVGARILSAMQNLAHQLDPTRLCTVAMDGRAQGKADGFSSVVDVQGFNYIHRGDMDRFHQANPNLPSIGTEEVSAYYTRGVYKNSDTYKSAYDDNKPDYGTSAEEWWTYYSARPWASGSFVWTGFDYRGEASPYRWPNISSEFGVVDTCGFPKDIFYYYQSWWTPKPMVHVMPHWTWPGREGQEIDVRCFSNCEEVEMFLNGQSLGRKAMPVNSHLKWVVKYAPGALSAKGYKGGEVAAEETVETTGAPSAVHLTPDRSVIDADGRDLSVFTVSVNDAQGRVAPGAASLVRFELAGPGKIIGVGNGDPICHEPDVYMTQNPMHSVAIEQGWRWKTVPDARREGLPEFGADFDDSSWKTTEVESEEGPLEEREQGVFRAKFQVSESDLAAAETARISVGRLDDRGVIYVNGQRAGEGDVFHAPTTLEVKRLLHPGENSVAVGVVNGGGPGGIGDGVTVEYQNPPVAAHWQRSVFNGLAQVLVQSTTESGELKLTATAEGLSPASKTIVSKDGHLPPPAP